MDRTRALEELEARVHNQNLIKHSLAVEAIMRGLAEYFHEEVELWGLAGLLHDIDYEETANDPARHSVLGAEILEELDVDSAVIYAVKAHNHVHGLPRRRKIDKALYAADPVSGLITAAVLILPTKKLEDVTLESVIKRFNEKSFARGANRDQIKTCDELGLSLEQFISIGLDAMKKISGELGL